MSAEARVVPANSIISLITVDPITAAGAPGEQYFAAVVSRDILNRSGDVLISNGSPATLIVLADERPSELELGLYSVMVDGEMYLLGPAGSTARASGRGVALGTLLDAVGPNSAPSEIITRGRRIHVPSGALLTFELTQPFRLEVSGGGGKPAGSVPAGL